MTSSRPSSASSRPSSAFLYRPSAFLYRPASRSMLYDVRIPLRECVLPPADGLWKRSRTPSVPSMSLGWCPTTTTVHSERSLHVTERGRPLSASNWRDGRVPPWWTDHLLTQVYAPPKPVELTPTMQAQVDGVVGQLRRYLHKSLDRTIDTFRCAPCVAVWLCGCVAVWLCSGGAGAAAERARGGARTLLTPFFADRVSSFCSLFGGLSIRYAHSTCLRRAPGCIYVPPCANLDQSQGRAKRLC